MMGRSRRLLERALVNQFRCAPLLLAHAGDIVYEMVDGPPVDHEVFLDKPFVLSQAVNGIVDLH